MSMTGDVTDRDLMLAQQGKRVLVAKADGSRHWALTIVHVVDAAIRALRLVNRDDKSRQPDWALSQKLWEAIEPAEANNLNCEYELSIK
jgi:hypothetical protein